MSVKTRAGVAPGVGLLRQQCFDAIRDMLSPAELASAVSCAERLMSQFPPGRPLADTTVLVAYGGGKDSSYTVTFVRLMQLILDRRDGSTFTIRTVTNWSPGMPPAVLANIDRAYRALGLYDDPGCELLLVKDGALCPFRDEPVVAPETSRRARLDVLMTGHRTAGNARPTFCNSCNLSMLNAFGLAAGHGRGVDVIITGDSSDEQRSYLRWVAGVARRIGASGKIPHASECATFLSTVNHIAQTYFTDIYGADAAQEVSARAVSTDVPQAMRFFSIYDDTEYASGQHWDLLTTFLGFEFDDIAFSFTESDCGNPALMAHMRGLKCEYLYHRSYAEGVLEYVGFALSLMRDKHFPDFLIQKARERYESAEGIDHMRQLMVRYSQDAFGLTDEQLLCMLYAPFGDRGAGLERYLADLHPELALQAADIRALLAGQDGGSGGGSGLAGALERISGLELRYLRQLYASPVRRQEPGGDRGRDVIGAILDGDPHKAVIKTQVSPHGPMVEEQISGR
jgi:hypothetical protein